LTQRNWRLAANNHEQMQIHTHTAETASCLDPLRSGLSRCLLSILSSDVQSFETDQTADRSKLIVSTVQSHHIPYTSFWSTLSTRNLTLQMLFFDYQPTDFLSVVSV